MITIGLLCLVLALICFVLATIGVASRVNLTALGLVFYMLSILLGRVV
jgi:hypothetical protein